MSAHAPKEVYKFVLDSKEAVQLTHLNDAVLSQVAMQPVESFWFAGAGGTKVQGFIIKPSNFDAQRKYPVKFLIHGGPQVQWGDEWTYPSNPDLSPPSSSLCIMINTP